jgi:hypothetical protein
VRALLGGKNLTGQLALLELRRQQEKLRRFLLLSVPRYLGGRRFLAGAEAAGLHRPDGQRLEQSLEEPPPRRARLHPAAMRLGPQDHRRKARQVPFFQVSRPRSAALVLFTLGFIPDPYDAMKRPSFSARRPSAGARAVRAHQALLFRRGLLPHLRQGHANKEVLTIRAFVALPR